MTSNTEQTEGSESVSCQNRLKKDWSELLNSFVEQFDNGVRAREYTEMENSDRRGVDLVFEEIPRGIRVLKPQKQPKRFDILCSLEFRDVFDDEISGIKTISELTGGGINQYEYSRDELITELRSVANEVERIPTLSDLQNHGDISQGPYYRVFDSFDDALAAAELLSEETEADNHE